MGQHLNSIDDGSADIPRDGSTLYEYPLAKYVSTYNSNHLLSYVFSSVSIFYEFMKALSYVSHIL